MTDKSAAGKYPRLLSLSSVPFCRLSKTRKHHRNESGFERTSCHLGMVRPLVSDGEGLHVRTSAANIFNNQSQMAERGRFSSGGIGKGTKSSPFICSMLQFQCKVFINGKNSSHYTWNVGIFCRTDYFGIVSRQLRKYE